jgi:monoamine oxidase
VNPQFPRPSGLFWWEIPHCTKRGFHRPGQWFTVRETLARPFKKVHFAGEHIADEQGFTEGAMDTGQSAARIVMSAQRLIGTVT